MELRTRIDYRPRNAFLEYHIRKQRFASLICHRRAGKTFAALHDAFSAVIRSNKQMPRGGFIAPLYKQAKSVAWDYTKAMARGVPGAVPNETELRIDVLDKRFQLFGADNPDALRGAYFDDLVLDEPADMDPRLWGEVVRPTLADRQGRCTIIGTLKGRDWFLENHRKAERDAENWFTMTLRASESGILLPDELEAMKRDMTPAQIAQELECSPEDSGATQFMPTYLVMQARERRADEQAYRHAPRILGVDVARHGDDSTCIIRRQGIKTHKPVLYRIPDLTKIAEEVITHIIEWDPDAVFVDATGIGWGVIDYLRKVGYGSIVHAVQTGEKAGDENRYYNKRVELWGKIKDWLPEADLPDDEVLVNDLTTPTVGYDLKNRYQLEKKEDIKARGLPSPDCFVAGTMVATPFGPKPIEAFREGDLVDTPFGPRRVIKVWESVTNSLAEVRFGNGATLAGKGSHKVFTWDAGWVRLDALSLTNDIESWSTWRIAQWRFANLSYTRARSSGFKAVVDTFRVTTRMRRRDFCIAACGSIISGRSQINTIFTMLTVIGATMMSTICNVFWAPSITDSTCVSVSPIRNSLPKTEPISNWRKRLPRFGTLRQKVVSGIRDMGRKLGENVNRWLPSAAYAASSTQPTSQVARDFAHVLANSAKDTFGTRPQKENVYNAVPNSRSINTASKNAVLASVLINCEQPVSVYNLTLDEDNVYYANGILVANCADALALTFAQHIAPRDPVNDEPEFLKRVATLRRGNRPRHHLAG